MQTESMDPSGVQSTTDQFGEEGQLACKTKRGRVLRASMREPRDTSSQPVNKLAETTSLQEAPDSALCQYS